MKLLEIHLCHFRQFYGEQMLRFSADEKNITIIFGENGKGKTGIFRALMFGLFGSTHLPQDNTKEKKVHLVNFIALEEAKGIPIDAYVTIKFENKGYLYELTREMKAVKIGSKIDERPGKVSLVMTDPDGNFSPEPIIDETEIKLIVNQILDEKIRDFFLFDAEKIETLTKTDAKVKEEVKTGIVKLLQIDKLENAISILKKVYNTENRRIVGNAQNLDLSRKQVQMEKINKDIKDLEELLELKEDNLYHCSQEIEQIELRLSENESIKLIQEKYQSEIEKQNIQKRHVKEKKENIKHQLVENGHQIFLNDHYDQVKIYLNQVLVDQKDLIPIEVIQKTLDEEQCACCQTKLSDNPIHLDAVRLLLNTYKRSELTPLITQMTSQIHDFRSEEKDILNAIENKLSSYREVKSEGYTLSRKIQQLKDEISDKAKETENLRQLEQTLQSKIDAKEQLHSEIVSSKYELDMMEKQQAQLAKEYQDLLRMNESLKTDYAILSHVDTLKGYLETIFDSYSQEMRQQLTKEATQIFKLLIDSKDRNLIDRIEITNKYEIDLIGWDDINITQDISQGQRQVVSLSFITALAKVAAGGRSKIDFPLFMDTPFGRISGNNRDHLIENLPYLTSQWILLLTDTELSRVEEEQFKKTNKLGCWYKLDQITTGHTQIIEVDLNETMSKRG